MFQAHALAGVARLLGIDVSAVHFSPADLQLTVCYPFGRLTVSGNPNARGAGVIKSELIERIAARNPHLFQRDVEHIVNAILEEVVAALARGDRVELRGFGAFSVKNRPARTGRNPRTGEQVVVSEKYVPFFKTGQGHARAPEQSRRGLRPCSALAHHAEVGHPAAGAYCGSAACRRQRPDSHGPL